MMEKSTWKLTLGTQISLCVALFVALNIGQPQKPMYRIERKHNEFYFVSVGGGFRSLKDQTHLLKLMGKAMELYNPQFVVNLSELGEDDPFLQNARQYVQSPKVPWYTASALKKKESDYSVKRIEISDWKALDMIIFHRSLQDSSSGSNSDHLSWLAKPLQASNSDWRIVAGFDPLVACDDNPQKAVMYNVLLKYGVDAYLSGQSCTNDGQNEGVSYINNRNETYRGPYFTSINGKRILHGDINNGFLLHRVSSLEIVTYLVTMEGDVVYQTSLRQGGRHFI